MFEDDPIFPILKRYFDMHKALNETIAEYKARMDRFGNTCAVCGQIGRAVVQSVEGKGFYYCEDSTNCKRKKD